MAATTNKPLKFAPITEQGYGIETYPVAAATRIWEGSLVALNTSGYVVPLTATYGRIFVGIATEKVDNRTGVNGQRKIRVLGSGVRVSLTVTGASIASVGQNVCAADDNTYTMTADMTNVRIGKVVEYLSDGTCSVELETATALIYGSSSSNSSSSESSVSSSSISVSSVSRSSVSVSSVSSSSVSSVSSSSVSSSSVSVSSVSSSSVSSVSVSSVSSSSVSSVSSSSVSSSSVSVSVSSSSVSVSVSSSSILAASPDYTVTSAGTTAVNGDYYQIADANGYSCYEIAGGGYYLYNDGVSRWLISSDTSHTYPAQNLYSCAAGGSEDPPSTGYPQEYDTNNGVAPGAYVDYAAVSSSSVSSSSVSSSSSSSSSIAAAGADYVVSGAGESAANGDYYEAGVYGSNNYPYYKKADDSSYLYDNGAGVGNQWLIHSTLGEDPAWYYSTQGAQAPTPHTGEYNVMIGSGPAPTVSAG